MKNLLHKYNNLMSIKSVSGLSNKDALEHIGSLTDVSFDLRKIDGLKQAIQLSEELYKREITNKQLAILNFFLANAWSNLNYLKRFNNERIWDWELKEVEKAIYHYRMALKGNVFNKLPKIRKCQILTNLANELNHVGRFIEAVEYWDRSLQIIPSFPMAIGNKGYGLIFYSQELFDEHYKAILLKFAHSYLKKALLFKLQENAKKTFEKNKNWIESILNTKFLESNIKLDNLSLGDSEEEIQYRRWCLENKFFLNPLNDLGCYSNASCDDFRIPPIIVKIDEGPFYPSYFDQMKQEFVSARYCYYEGIISKRPHFSDKKVILFNSLDYPSYSLNIEKVKSSFKMIYSLFDKISFFLNNYFNLNIPEKRINFKNLWYNSEQKQKGIKDVLINIQNWSLRGLYWLSKDLSINEKDKDFVESLEPDAQSISDIRNNLEHKYLKLHEDEWCGSEEKKESLSSELIDTLSYSIYRQDFETKTLRLIKMARAALIYLSLAINTEERSRVKGRDTNTIVPQVIDIWEDDWKV